MEGLRLTLTRRAQAVPAASAEAGRGGVGEWVTA